MPVFPVVSSCSTALWLRRICARLTLPCLFLSRLDLCSFPSSLTTRSVGFMLVSHTDGLQRGRMDRAALCSFLKPTVSKGDGWIEQPCARSTHRWHPKRTDRQSELVFVGQLSHPCGRGGFVLVERAPASAWASRACARFSRSNRAGRIYARFSHRWSPKGTDV